MRVPISVLLPLLSLLPQSLASIPDTFLLPRQSVCQTPGFVPCNPPGSAGPVSVPAAAFNGGGSGFWGSLQSAASSPIQKVKREIEGGLVERQSGGLCCRPAPVECLYTRDQGVPFCYTPATTRMYFSDGSYGFVSNGTYYGADGSFVNYKTGHYTLANGTSGTFTPVNDGSGSPTSSSAAGTPTPTGPATAPSASAKSEGLMVIGDPVIASTIMIMVGVLFAATF